MSEWTETKPDENPVMYSLKREGSESKSEADFLVQDCHKKMATNKANILLVFMVVNELFVRTYSLEIFSQLAIER